MRVNKSGWFERIPAAAALLRIYAYYTVYRQVGTYTASWYYYIYMHIGNKIPAWTAGNAHVNAYNMTFMYI